MKRITLFVTLICFLSLPFQVGFSQENPGQRGEYHKRIESQLTEFQKTFQDLKKKGAELDQAAKGEFNEGLKELQKKEEAANRKLAELKSASAKTWERQDVGEN
jgi:hypothetical protein